MESNTPPKDNQSSPNNILSPPFIRYNPSDVRVVSQSQSRIRSHSESHHSEDYQLDRLVEDAANHDFVTQTPMREVSSVAPVSTPINSTPTKKQRVELAASKLFTADPNAQLLAQKKRDDLMASIDKKHRKYANPKDGILWWLRSERLSVQRAITSTKKLNLSHKYNSISSSWYNEKTARLFNFKPFESMKSTITSGASPLTHRHRRMLLEDIILLLPGSMVVCLISPSHLFFSSSGNVAFRNKMELAMQHDPLNIVTLGDDSFFAVNFKVISNPNGDEIAAGIPTRKLLKQYCLNRVYGAGINCQFVTGESVQFKFVEFFENDDLIHLWHTPKTSRVSHIRRVLQNLSSALSLAPTTLLLLREVHGDTFYSQTICAKHDACIVTKTHNRVLVDLKAETVTTKGIQIMFELRTDDPMFRMFHDKVESICKQSIMDCYGNFTPLSAAILCEVR